MSTIAYKLAWVDTCGAFRAYTAEAAQLRYEIGKITRPRPKCGPLTAFVSLGAAKLFLVRREMPTRHFHRCVFLRCEVEPCRPQGPEPE